MIKTHKRRLRPIDQQLCFQYVVGWTSATALKKSLTFVNENRTYRKKLNGFIRYTRKYLRNGRHNVPFFKKPGKEK